ncbi:unnamed protein product, partial [Rotaria socialis]
VGLTSRSIDMLCQGLPKCVHLNLLDLSWNKINKQSFEILVDTINHLPLLIYLSLSNCGIRDSYGRPIGEICRHKRLMDINLTGNEFEEMACIFIGNALTDNMKDLSWNKINKQSFEILADTINHLPLLIYLSLSNCGIRDSYGRPIGEICRHKRLMDINLTGNEFEEMACIFIGNALTDNTSLKDLNISWNFIRSYATIALLRGFETNRTLTNFDISWSNLGYDGSVALRRVLIANTGYGVL